LQYVHIAAEAGRCTLLASDLEMGIRVDLPDTRILEPGEVLVPCGRFLALLRESTDDELSIEGDAQTCIVRGHISEFTLGTEDPNKFPDVPTFTGEDYHEIVAGMLRQMVQRTIFAAAIENPRFAFTGTLWELEADRVRLVATDGRRLAVADGSGTPHGDHHTNGQTHVVATKAMKLLKRILQDPDENVVVTLRPNHALFKIGRVSISSRLVDGRYIAYREVFPKKQTIEIPLSVGPFYAAVRQTAIMTDDENKKVVFSFTKKKLTLQARGATDEAQVSLAIDYKGAPLTIALDPEFLVPMLRKLNPEDALTLQLIDARSVALFRRGDDYSYLVLPITIDEKTASSPPAIRECPV
jgi:DNA polymerase-3 subunit beta